MEDRFSGLYTVLSVLFLAEKVVFFLNGEFLWANHGSYIFFLCSSKCRKVRPPPFLTTVSHSGALLFHTVGITNCFSARRMVLLERTNLPSCFGRCLIMHADPSAMHIGDICGETSRSRVCLRLLKTYPKQEPKTQGLSFYCRLFSIVDRKWSRISSGTQMRHFRRIARDRERGFPL